jgi:hypothetical protein
MYCIILEHSLSFVSLIYTYIRARVCVCVCVCVEVSVTEIQRKEVSQVLLWYCIITAKTEQEMYISVIQCVKQSVQHFSRFHGFRVNVKKKK